MSDAWTRCELCGARLKTANLQDHKAEVHPAGAASEEERHKVQRRRALLRKAKVGAIAVVALVATVAAGYALTQAGETTPSTLTAAGEPSIGSEDANLTVYLFQDYQCPHCARFETQGGFDHLQERWIKPGTVRVVFKDFAFIGPDSKTAAEASQCVYDQAPSEWPSWHRMVFENQRGERSGWASVDNLQHLTREWGRIDMEPFTACLGSGRFAEEVEADTEAGKANGVSGTPMMVVGDRVINAMDTQMMDAAIRQALREGS